MAGDVRRSAEMIASRRTLSGSPPMAGMATRRWRHYGGDLLPPFLLSLCRCGRIRDVMP